MTHAEFDSYADSYRDQHQTSVRIGGEETEFYSEYKIADILDDIKRLGLAHDRILDFGAGIGNSVPFFEKYFAASQVTYLDVSSNSLELCERNATMDAQFSFYDGKTIPFETGSFDVIFTACVFHHIPPEDHVSLLAEIRRVLRPGGRFYLFEHNPWNPLTRHVVNQCPFDENAILISAPEMSRRLKSAGFRTVEDEYRIFFPAPLARLRPAEKLLGWLPLGAQYRLSAAS